MEDIFEIEYGEHCFGSYVNINGQSLHYDEYNKEEQNIKINILRKSLINELNKIIDKVSTSDIRTIAEIITTVSDEFEYNEEESIEHSSCDQCGNWNYSEKYNKNINEKFYTKDI